MDLKKLLICNNGHIGDAIIATSLLPFFKQKYPHLHIGFLASSEGSVVVDDHIHVDQVYCFNHPLNIRKAWSKKRRKKESSKSWLKALENIKKENYDVAIDLYTLHKSNASSLLYRARIPLRMGYGLYGSHYNLNYLLRVPPSTVHLVDRYKELLEEIGFKNEDKKCVTPILDYKNPINYIDPSLKSGAYIVVHSGSGDLTRFYSLSSWKRLFKRLKMLSMPIVFVGKGSRESLYIEQLISVADNGLNLCDQLNFKELVDLVSKAHLFLGVESMVGHIAAAFNIKSVNLYGGRYNIDMWRPYSKNSSVIRPETQYFKDSLFAPHYSAINLIDEEKIIKILLEKHYESTLS